ncbi:ABC transporter ATP-binding protein [Dongia sedimenti]|uniref:ATP-binding cassette domain-containing protein n=1 Tax=Dongia sedimenti TaxID=3064282 RepID=A0ABU0YRQ1_9PROT|nr:ATP-binding cassette domain-containing protein [Rhodospirillaceae bacterium R-7]
MLALSVQGLSVVTPQRRVVDGVGFEVAGGEILAILGETGSGKSLIGSAIMGLLPAGVRAEGMIALAGASKPLSDQAALRGHWSSDLFLLPQEPFNALAPLLSVLEQVAEQTGLTGRDRWNRAVGAMAEMQLSAEHFTKKPYALSGGMAQRVMAAIASVTRAGILIADEPTKGLDADRRAAVADVFRLLRDQGRAILLITHDIALVRNLADRVAFLHEGRFVETGSTEAVLSAPQSAYARLYVTSDPASWQRRAYAPSSTPKVIGAEALRIGFNGRVLADAMTFHCHASQIAALLGSSGIGKTTLGRTLLGLVPPVAGTVRRYFTQGASPARPLQKLHQDPTRVFSPWQSLGRSMRDIARLPGGEAGVARIPGLMRRFALKPDLLDRRPDQISGGEAQRLALARVLALRPQFLLADEPTSRLDPPVQAEVIRHLRNTADEDGLAVLLITHDRALAEAIADRRLLMRRDGPGPAGLSDITDGM